MQQQSPIVILGGGVAGLVMAAVGALSRPAALLLELLPRRYSHFLLGGNLVPLHSRLLGIYAGLALALACGFALWYRHLCRRPDFHFLKTGRGKFLFAILVVLALLTLALSVNRVFWDDEIEHIHASWYVQNGQVPYRDFFEHHHPLLWFLLAPVIWLCGQGLLALGVARFLILLMVAGIAWLTWRISRLAGGNAETACLAVAILFANILFLPCVMEIRPDIPMVLLALAAVERLLVFLKEAKPQQLLAAALLASLSFLFLQKAAFLVAAMVLWAGWRMLAGKIRPVHFAWAAVVFLLPLLVFLAWLAGTGAFHDYMLCNWMLNLQRTNLSSAPWLVIGRMALANIVFWMAVPPALFRAFRLKANAVEMKMLAWFAVVALGSLLLYPNPGDRYFLLPLPLLSIAVSVFICESSGFLQLSKWRAVLLTGLLAVPLPLLTALSFPLNGVQLEKIAYVLRQTKPADRVLDGTNDFNLFRPDLHYFWFNTSLGLLDDYRRSGGGRHVDYDVCRLIKEKKPRLIKLDNREWSACGVWREYVSTPYMDLFFREEGP